METRTQVGDVVLGQPDAGVKVFLVHGYTGSPTDFNRLPQFLHENLGARVKVVLLPGHGTHISDLDNISYQDFVGRIEQEFEEEMRLGGKMFVGGISFGSLMALRLAAKYPVDGLVNVCLPYSLKLPFGMPGAKWLGYFKKYWKKKIHEFEEELREGSFHYRHMHINGLGIVKQARRDVVDALSAVTCPVVTIHSVKDPIGSVRGVKRLQRHIRPYHQVVTYTNPNHNIFYSPERQEVYQRIGDFIQQTAGGSQSWGRQHRVAAVVPAYNEAERIKPVLEVLKATPVVNEVIVVDDGSTDKTGELARSVPGVLVLENRPNIGKAASLQRAIDQTAADVLFFCDADLEGLTPEIVAEIIQPVLAGQRDMFIGVRNNVTQKALTLFALNSGERALRRELWEAMPEIFKYRYRLEVGLNATARWRPRGYGWKKFDYYQTFKERKYGLLKGTLLRWWMNMDVLYAYALVVFSRWWIGRGGKGAEEAEELAG